MKERGEAKKEPSDAGSPLDIIPPGVEVGVTMVCYHVVLPWCVTMVCYHGVLP